ncbi:DNA cytosine methyltransferase [bacterium]|nr:MAG: DNA cytosine methyltransferase [bacterium]
MSILKNTFYEFFAGGGMVRAGLGEDSWECVFANDFDHKKGRVYRANFGGDELRTADIRSLKPEDLPGQADLAWASFPCQDLSLAGGGAGLKGDRSGTFWPFWSLMEKARDEGRAPKMIVLENVCGTLTSHDGSDFASICDAFARLGYKFGALVIDAALFVPQSRPRLFVIGVRKDLQVPECLMVPGASAQWHTRALRIAYDRLPHNARRNWVWWKLPPPPLIEHRFADLIEDAPKSVKWDSDERTRALLAMMTPLNRAKVESAERAGKRMVGTIYKRTRVDENGEKAQRAEVRFDDIAGCLRTPVGGSSRQLILVVEGDKVRSRLISARETARLMGLPDCYMLPDSYNEAYHLTGDGVVVPVVEHLARHIFEPMLESIRFEALTAA